MMCSHYSKSDTASSGYGSGGQGVKYMGTVATGARVSGGMSNKPEKEIIINCLDPVGRHDEHDEKAADHYNDIGSG